MNTQKEKPTEAQRIEAVATERFLEGDDIISNIIYGFQAEDEENKRFLAEALIGAALAADPLVAWQEARIAELEAGLKEALHEIESVRAFITNLSPRTVEQLTVMKDLDVAAVYIKSALNKAV